MENYSSKLKRNSIYNALYKGFTAFFPIITMAYISRVLMPEGIGRVEYANTVVSYFVTIASLGLPTYGVRVIAQNLVDNKQENKAFFELFVINFISTMLMVFAYFMFVNLMPHFANRRLLFNVMGLLLILNIFNCDWFYQGIEEYGYIATRSVLIKIVSFVFMVLFVKSSKDYIAYALILCVATAGNNLCNIIYVRKYIEIGKYHLNLKKHIRPLLILLASTLATQVYTMLDSIMLEAIHGEVSVGLYSNAVKIVRMVYTVSIALVNPFYPRISRLVGERESNEVNRLMSEGTKLILLIALPCVTGIIAVAPSIIRVLFGAEFLPSTVTLRILSVLIVVFSVAFFDGHIILMGTGHERKILIASVIGAIVNFTANSILIPPLKQNGAALASVLAEVIVTLIVVVNAKRYYHITLAKKFMMSCVVASLCTGFIAWYVCEKLTSSIVGLGTSIVIGIICYGLCLIVTRNEFAVTCAKMLFRKKN